MPSVLSHKFPVHYGQRVYCPELITVKIPRELLDKEKGLSMTSPAAIFWDISGGRRMIFFIGIYFILILI